MLTYMRVLTIHCCCGTSDMVFDSPPTKFIMNWVLRDMIRNASSNDSDAASNSAQGQRVLGRGVGEGRKTKQ